MNGKQLSKSAEKPFDVLNTAVICISKKSALLKQGLNIIDHAWSWFVVKQLIRLLDFYFLIA